MTAKLSLMVTPTRLEDNKEGPPQFYVLRGSVWRDVPLSSGPIGQPSEWKASIEKVLTTIMNNVGANGAHGARPALQAQFFQYWMNCIPETVKSELTDLHRTDDDPPCLMLHVHPSLEWIPWELMHDNTDFLGLRYVIARLPIVPRGPSSIAARRAVQRVCTFLGEHVMDGPQQQEWATTFDGLPNGVTVDRFPANGSGNWPAVDAVIKAADADILHITCHGGITDTTFNTVWTLNDQGMAHIYGLGQAVVQQMSFADQGPLVFGNACQSTAGAATATGLTPGLAYSFFDKGATAFIGAFAPISKPLALRFATTFYAHLLREGLSVGSALWRTKSDFKVADQQDPSWLFYCLYGPPETQFVVT